VAGLVAGVLNLLAPAVGATAAAAAKHGRVSRSRMRSTPRASAPGIADRTARPRALDLLAETRPTNRLGKHCGRPALGGPTAVAVAIPDRRKRGSWSVVCVPW